MTQTEDIKKAFMQIHKILDSYNESLLSISLRLGKLESLFTHDLESPYGSGNHAGSISVDGVAPTSTETDQST